MAIERICDCSHGELYHMVDGVSCGAPECRCPMFKEKEHFKCKLYLGKTPYCTKCHEFSTPHHPSPEKEVSQEQPSYIDKVVEEARKNFDLAKASVGSPISFSQWLREKLESAMEYGGMDCVARNHTYLRELERKEAKTAERQRIREIVEEYRAAVFNRDVHGEYRLGVNDVVEALLARLSEE